MLEGTNQTPKKFGDFLMQLAEKSDHVYWLSSPDFQTIEYVSPAYEKIWGRKVQELYLHPEKWITFMHPEDAARFHPIEAMKDSVKQIGPAARYIADYRIIRPSGEVRWIMDRGFPIYDDQGNCCGITGVALDVTTEKQAEIELEKAKNAAESANRAKTEFLEGISHDVITPLVTLRLIGETIMENTDENISSKGNMIASCAQRLLSFFKDCLKSSHIELSTWSAKEDVFSLTTVLDDIHALFFPTAKTKHLAFNISYDPTIPKKLIGHRDSIYRVILNLVGNALKFTENGEISVRAFVAERLNENKIIVGIEVKDTGMGIPEDKHQVIFKRLQRLTPSYESQIEGSGIGLYIVDQYVKRMGGEIQVKSKVGEGSAFIVKLPLKILFPAT